jgi:hypothetical protein
VQKEEEAKEENKENDIWSLRKSKILLRGEL